MKRYTLALLAVSTSVTLAGDPSAAKSGQTPIKVPTPAPAWSWFAGAGGGYLLDKEEDMWNAHVGVDLPWKLAGFDQSIFLEVGWVSCDSNVTVPGRDYGKGRNRGARSVGVDLDIVPISVNYKIERAIVGNLAMYLGGGIGVAYSHLDPDGGGDDDDWTFYGQVFGGLLYNVSENIELYAGARWIYLDSPEFSSGGTSIEATDDSDWLLEAGGRVNF